ncbi:MAG: sigma-70 family RNA polymerase sigma factor [Pirellulales bacterium]|nr:sigma-70 family RNA polymerase sigma factor [Pirellulales bacterium]
MTEPDSTRLGESSDRTREFLLLLSQHDRALYAYILALIPNVAEVQDIAQEVRLRLWEQFDKFEPGTNFGAWSRTIAHYLVLAHRKKSSRRHAQLGEAFLECVAEEVSQTVSELPDRQVALQVCLGRLRAKARDLLMRYYSGKHTAKQLAEEVGQSAAAVRQAISRSRRELAQCIDREMRKEAAP